MTLDHVGVATDDAAGLAALCGDLLDAPVVHEETFAGLRIVFVDVGGTDLELLEPVDADGDDDVSRYLERHGPGLHHLAFEVADLEGAMDRARDLGLELIDETPRSGARGHEVAFLHPRSTGDVLVEFVAHADG